MRQRVRYVQGATGVCAALLCSVLLLVWATDGFAVLTTDGARARRVQRAPVQVPDVSVRSSSGDIHRVLRDGTSTLPRAAIVDFVYTRCMTVCGALGGSYQLLQQEILARGLQDRIRLLTISFDVERDDPRSLALYARVHRARADVWSLVTPVDSAARNQLLSAFGIQVVPDGTGGWVHNAALHVVNPDGQLVRIVDITDGETALTMALDAWKRSR